MTRNQDDLKCRLLFQSEKAANKAAFSEPLFAVKHILVESFHSFINKVDEQIGITLSPEPTVTVEPGPVSIDLIELWTRRIDATVNHVGSLGEVGFARIHVAPLTSERCISVEKAAI